MNARSALAMGVVLGAALVAAGFWRWSSPTGVGAGDGPLSSADLNQSDAEQRISRLEDEIKALKQHISRNARDRDRARGRAPTPQTPFIENADAAARHEKFRSDLSASFANQPVDPAWARRTRIALEEALVTTAAEQVDFPAPESTRMQCRSSTCRIEASYPDEDAALYGVQILQSAFAPSLPRTHQYSVNNPDGTTTIVMYASKGPV